MKKIKLIALISLFSINLNAQESTITVFDEILFYDGYAGLVSFPTPEGVIRHRNDLYSKKLSADDLSLIGNNLNLSVIIKAACDNYDRIGNVNLAFVPKGESSYHPDSVQRIEIARYITPFMNKNIQPDEVPYSYQIDNVSKIFKDEETNQQYDFWVELQVFGVPYAANNEVAGCAGRNDVFFGTLKLTSTPEQFSSNNFVLPLNFQNNLNDYQEGASDAIGQTKRTIDFSLPLPLIDAQFFLITSNHGANSGGEEYNRRMHYIYFDENLVLSYKPGEPSCEPYRQYNTQGNGIYGPSPRTDAQWQSFSNWCPGAAIPIREISLGNLSEGQHSFKIDVPTAIFANNEGNFPVSVYLQGTRNNLGTDFLTQNNFKVSPNPATDKIFITSKNDLVDIIEVFDILGNSLVLAQKSISSDTIELNIQDFDSGTYFIHISSKQNLESFKIIKM
ncbi:MAG: T9SS type A sorting domain-containing protein [Flavobacteriia bacterium]|nr:T9SS type A sorting domain-containing protein [Flavobacteriia bacterium]